jgi:hypothetical protein
MGRNSVISERSTISPPADGSVFRTALTLKINACEGDDGADRRDACMPSLGPRRSAEAARVGAQGALT